MQLYKVWEVLKIGKDVTKNAWPNSQKTSPQMSPGFWLKALFIITEDDIPFTKEMLLSSWGLSVGLSNDHVARAGFCQNYQVMRSIGRVKQGSTVTQWQRVLGIFA